ncbi:MAG: carboxypeptidase-like regulatory domain-containing protein [Candidatus Micrarchaeia archaeon]
MVVPMRIPALIALLLLLPILSASVLTVQVVVDQDTPSIGASVSLVTGGVVLDTKKADQSGYVKFNVSDGTYFITVNKSVIYPQYLVYKEVSGDSEVRIVRRQLINYANAYGQITGPSTFANASVAAYLNNQVVKRVSANKDGFYILSYLNEGTYELRFESPGMETERVQVFLPTAEFTPIYAALKAPVAPEEPPVVLSSPLQVQQFALIEITLTKGGKPIAGQAVSVNTPSGAISATTDSQGIARVNAAEGGVYTFAYGNQTTTTSVAVPETPKPNESNKPPAQNQTPPAGNETANPPSSDGNGLMATLAAVLVILTLIILAVVAIVAAKLMREGKKDESKGQPHEHAQHGHAHHHAEGAKARHKRK